MSDEISGVLSVLPEAVIGVAADQTIVFFNQSAVAIFGHAAEEMLGRPLELLLPEAVRTRHRALVEGFRTAPTDALVMHDRREVSGRRADGSEFPAEVSLAKGRWQGQAVMFAILRDVSEQRQRQAALEASERKYRAIIDASPEPILIADAESGRLTEANPAAAVLFDCSRSDLIGLHQSELHPEATRARFRQTFQEHIDTGRIAVPDAVIQTASGREVPVEIYASPVEIDQRLHLVGFFRDMTERIAHADRLEEAVNDANAAVAAKRMFLANMTHELRTPLNGIIGFAELLGREIHGAHAHPSYREYADIIHQSGHHLLSIVNDLLDLSSLEVGKLALADEAVDIAAIAEECRRMLGRILADGEVRLTVRVTPGLGLLADRRALKQMLLNLLSNALKFTRRRSEVALHAAVNDKGEIEISVADSGVGIEPQRLAAIAEPFASGGNPYSRQKGGTGIGLSITKGLIERHGGRFEIESELGRGTTVRLVFPPERALREQVAAEILTKARRHSERQAG